MKKAASTHACAAWKTRMLRARDINTVRAIMEEETWQESNGALPRNSPRRPQVRLDVEVGEQGTKVIFVTFPNIVRRHERLVSRLPGSTQVRAS